MSKKQNKKKDNQESLLFFILEVFIEFIGEMFTDMFS